jgi:uncharacterized protein (DUF2252 family)
MARQGRVTVMGEGTVPGETTADLLAAGPGQDELAAFLAPRPSQAERRAAGRLLRDRVPRSSHAALPPDAGRADPVDRLAAQNALRLAELVPLRMGRMASSPFAFLRGSAGVMAADLARLDRTGPEVMACGDMHLVNFGLFASAERNLVFAINDFDEVHPGPWEWDLKRLAASAAVAVRHLGGPDHAARDTAEAVVRSYQRHMRRYARMGILQVWYDRIDEATILGAVPRAFDKRTRKIIDKARTRGHQRSLERLTEEVDGHHRLIEDHPIVVRTTHLSDGTPVPRALDAMLADYQASLPDDRDLMLRRFRIVDVVRKVVGVGSVGTSCWVLLMEGEGADDPLFLQVKEAAPSVLAEFLPGRSVAANQGARVVMGQRLIQGSPDIFLGWGRSRSARATDFYVRQLADMKGSLDLVANDRGSVSHITAYCQLCGWALALAHAKSGDAAVVAGYIGRSDALADALGRFAMAYADRTEADHAGLIAAIRANRVRADIELGRV